MGQSELLIQDLIQWEWFIPIFLAVAMAVVALARILAGKLRTFRVTGAEILEIQPQFTRQSPLKTAAVACSYSFLVRDRSYEGRVILPLSFFLRPGAPPAPVIVQDARIQLPILFFGKQRLVGTELIEHLLLQKNGTIPIRYNLRDPARHSVVVTGDSEAAKSTRNIKSSDVL